MPRISEKIESVQTRLANATGNCEKPLLLAVSKPRSASDIREASVSGLKHFGENYLQEALPKIAELQGLDLIWHFIGSIQSNKTTEIAQHFDWVHSVDRLKIAQRLSEQRPAHLPPLNICLQVNIDGGPTKAGVSPTDALALAQAVSALPRLVLRGLMTIPDPVESFDAQVAVYTQAKRLFDDLHAALALPQFDTLSMGMSADLEAAVQAGSTMVRVGTAVFGGR